MATIQSDILSAFHNIASSTFRSYSPYLILSRASSRRVVPLWSWSSSTTVVTTTSLRLRAFSSDSCEAIIKVRDKPSICTADELHYVSVPNSDWRLALWRYRPPPEAPPRNHPLLLLSGVGTNAIGYDLSPGSSFARYMSGQGFDTWILEVRGAGLSVQGSNVKEIEQSAHAISEQMEAASESVTNGSLPTEQQSSKFPGAVSESKNVQGLNFKDTKQSAHAISKQMEAVSESATNGALLTEQQSSSLPGGVSESKSSVVKEEKSDVLAVKGDVTGLATVWDESRLVSRLSETFMSLSERLSGFLSESQSKVMSAKLLDQISKLLGDSQLSERYNEIRGKLSSLLETRENTGIANQIRDLSQRLVNIIDEGQRSVSPPLFDLKERFSSTLEDFQKQLELIVKYDWDFDHYLEEDVPAVMEYIRAESKPKDGKLLAIGHSMGGILLYAMLSRFGFEGKDPKLAAVVTLASSLDYTSSKSTLKLLLPLADPAQALNVPVVPLGTLLSAAYPLSSSPPYVLSWLNSLISAEDMMDTELLRKLVLNNFCTIPVKLLLQLTTAFREGGLCDRSGTFFYKDHLNKSNVPVLALAGDRDLICPPEAVEETVKLIPEHLVSYKLFGEPTGPHYAHYDLVGGRKAVEQVYPCIIEFLSCNDK